MRIETRSAAEVRLVHNQAIQLDVQIRASIFWRRDALNIMAYDHVVMPGLSDWSAAEYFDHDE